MEIYRLLSQCAAMVVACLLFVEIDRLRSMWPVVIVTAWLSSLPLECCVVEIYRLPFSIRGNGCCPSFKYIVEMNRLRSLRPVVIVTASLQPSCGLLSCSAIVVALVGLQWLSSLPPLSVMEIDRLRF
eukprot:scaffold4061_cov163-Amphora_coffeaeformis.AAC.2